MRGMRLCPPERILASAPSLTRRPVASSIVRGAWYSKTPGIMSAPFRLAGDILWFHTTEDRAETYWRGLGVSSGWPHETKNPPALGRRRRDHSGRLKLLDAHREEEARVLALHTEEHRGALAVLGHALAELGHALHRLLVHFHDHVAALEPGVGGGAAVHHVLHHQTLGRAHAELLGEGGRQGLNGEAEGGLGLLAAVVVGLGGLLGVEGRHLRGEGHRLAV